MKQKVFLTGTIVFLIITASINIYSEDILSPETSKQIIEKIRSREEQYYKKYRGIEYLRTELIKELDPSDDKLLSTSNLIIKRKEYFYEQPDYTVIEYEKNGKKMKPSDYEGSKRLPLFPVFDEKSTDRYDTAVEGYETVEGKNCYRIKITPKTATERHLSGYILYDINDLIPVMIYFTIAKLPFGLKEFSYKGYFNQKENHGYMREFIMTMQIKLPLLYSRKFITTCDKIEAKPIDR